MASIHGTSCVVSLDATPGGSPVDVTTYVDDVSPELSQAIHEATVFGNTAIARVPGLKDGKCGIKFISNTTILAQLIAIYNAQTPGSSSRVSLVVGPNGSASGKPRLSFEMILTNFPIPAVVNDIERIQTTWEADGGGTLDTY
jgi:hypothetical protein